MSEKAIIEAALFVSTGPVKEAELAKKTGVEKSKIKKIIEELKKEYEKRGSGIVINIKETGYHMTVDSDIEDNVLGLIPETDMPKAMIKTLALIAYEQPIKQSYIVKIRGTRAYYYIKKLKELDLIEGRKKGHTKILSTTSKFKKYFDLKDMKNKI